MRIRVALFLLFTLASLPVFGRVISYSPYTDQSAVPAHQHRMNRHFALVEGVTWWGGGELGAPMPPMAAGGNSLVLYDFLGETEPRTVFPQEGEAVIHGAAVRENAAGIPSILTLATLQSEFGFRMSTDAGATWKRLDIPAVNWIQQMPTGVDTGGPFAGARGSQIRIGTERWPFIVSTRSAIYAIRDDGFVRSFLEQPSGGQGISLMGTDRTGARVVAWTANSIEIIDVVSGTVTRAFSGPTQVADAFIATDGSIYAEEWLGGSYAIVLIRNGNRTVLRESSGGSGLQLFAVPSHDYESAWILQRGTGQPTTLYRHSVATGLVKQWDDISGPEVEALHTGSSGNKLLIQVHRPRPQADQRMFLDPALAVWRVGEPAPRHYDELYMDEQWNKGFVHLDVEKIEAGEPFVFDSGFRFMNGGGGDVSPTPPSSGGGDVVQEWGVVRASLKQRLVLPAVGRTRGAFESNWVTDVIIYNPVDAPQRVDIRFAPSGAPTSIAEHQVRTVELAAKEIRLIDDVLLNLFGIESGLGAFFIEPEAGITMTSRTYTKSAEGTYGFGMYAMDVYAAAASARFPLTFSGGLLGDGYRTNMIVTDAGESGSLVNVRAAGGSGLLGLANVMFEVTPHGQQQFNSIGPMLGVYPHETGGLIFRPTRGSATAAVFAIDNRTNDTTYFPPDLPAPVVRTIPAIGHVDGANDSHFRTDLYLHNPSSNISTVTLQVRMWGSSDTATISFTLLPREARIIRDALVTLFGRQGIARLRYQSENQNQYGVRVTSRTYSVREDGGTYGFLMPPLNSFQSGGAGDTLEILGAVADQRFRTNIGLVELTGVGAGAPINTKIDIIDSAGRIADSFTVGVPFAGGMQLNDVFNSRGLTITGPVLIRISPLGGHVGAYATHIDNRTNDASYLSANLGAK